MDFCDDTTCVFQSIQDIHPSVFQSKRLHQVNRSPPRPADFGQEADTGLVTSQLKGAGRKQSLTPWRGRGAAHPSRHAIHTTYPHLRRESHWSAPNRRAHFDIHIYTQFRAAILLLGICELLFWSTLKNREKNYIIFLKNTVHMGTGVSIKQTL